MDTHTKVNSELAYIDAVSDDHKLLTETAIASKKAWGYSDELMDLWKPDLEIKEEYILRNKVVKVFDCQTFIGFFGLKLDRSLAYEIDHLWLIPDKIKMGYGTQIFHYIKNYLNAQGQKTVQTIADPNANFFYEKLGGRLIGQIESKVKGRFLNIYVFQL